MQSKLRELREKANFSQVELARRARMASTNLSAIENGKLAPWPKVMKRLARVLKVPVNEVFPTGWPKNE